MLIRDFILLYVNRKHKNWTKLGADGILNKLKVFQINNCEMSIMIQQIINCHQLKNEYLILNKSDSFLSHLKLQNINLFLQNQIVKQSNNKVITIANNNKIINFEKEETNVFKQNTKSWKIKLKNMMKLI